MSLRHLVRLLVPLVLMSTASLLGITGCDDDPATADGDTTPPDADTSPDLQTCDDCAPGLHCQPTSGACVECLDDTHCVDSPNGSACAANLCVVPECDDDTDCDVGEACLERRCQTADTPCSTAFDCPAEQPACVALGPDTRVCRAFGECLDDDDAEPDDGPNGARRLDIAPNGTQTATARLCSAPSVEVDTWTFTVDDGDRVTLVVGTSEPDADLDIEVYDRQLAGFGVSLWRSPEVIDLGYLPAGDYFLEVALFTGAQPRRESIDYSVEITRTPGACTGAADCAASWDSAALRLQCAASGACLPLTVSEPRADGEPCDSSNDCESELCAANISVQNGLGSVVYSFFEHADTRAVCTRECRFDADCADGLVCEPTSGLCAVPCTADDECPVYTSLEPLDGDAWRHMTCDAVAQRCVQLDPTIVGGLGPLATDTQLTLDTVATHGPGIVVVSADDGAQLGFVTLNSGSHQDVAIATTRPLVRGEQLRVALHRDLTPVGTWEAGVDPPAARIDGTPVTATLDVR